jgi:acyl-coenzyme A thioesterase 13
MHGGAAGVIFDMCTTTALGPLARPGFWEWVSFLFISDVSAVKLLLGMALMTCGSFLGGVTRSLNISYLKAIPMGTSPPPPLTSIPIPC